VTHPYRARFIDTSTAAPWNECYHPDHPTTRTQSREARMRVLEYMSRDFDLSRAVKRDTTRREMLTHEGLTADHTVQRTTFEGGKTVTVNLGNRPFTMPNGTIIPPMDLN
jgi:hypothetical protein